MVVENPNPNAVIKSLLCEELLRASGIPLETILDRILTDWLASTNGQSARIGSTRNAREAVERRLAEGDVIGAAVSYIEIDVPAGPVARSAGKIMRRNRQEIALALSRNGEEAIIKDRPSATFALGSSAHNLMERLVVNQGDVGKLVDPNIALISDGNNITGYTLLRSQGTQLVLGGLGIHEEDKRPVEIAFEESIALPNEGESVPHWALRVFENSLGVISGRMGKLPGKPYDIEKVIADPTTKSALMQTLEVAHVIFGHNHNLSFVEWEDESRESGVINLTNVEEFATLNWLSIVKRALEFSESESSSKKDEGILAEISEGQLRFKINGNGGQGELEEIVPVGSQRIDVMRVHWLGQDEGGNDSVLSLNKSTQLIEGEFHSQGARHRRSQAVNGDFKEVKTALPRNLNAFFREQVRLYGEKVFTDIVVDIDDFKFPGGDGGWFTQFDPNNLPDRGHVVQMSGYIFKTLAQLYSVYKRDRNIKECEGLKGLLNDGDQSGLGKSGKLLDGPDWEDFPIKVEEVIDFALEFNVLSRINGNIRYQLPQREVISKVNRVNLNREELIEWGYKMAGLSKGSSSELRERQRVLRALRRLTQHKLAGAPVLHRESSVLPNALTKICVDYRGIKYLSIADLALMLKEKISSKEIDIVSSVGLVEEGVKIFVVEGLLLGVLVRIAVKDDAQFCISGYPEGNVVGKLLSNKTMKGVAEAIEPLVKLFDRVVWEGVLKEIRTKNVADVQNIVKDGEMLYPDGTWHKLVEGKPVVCKYDLLTGRWRLDFKLLKDYMESDASRDRWGIHRLARHLIGEDSERKSWGGPVFCPMPDHDNRITAAAHLYGKGDNPHIWCFNCATNIYLPHSGFKTRIERLPLSSGDEVQDYRPVSEGRQNTFEVAMQVGHIFASNSEIPEQYLIKERGLSPEDVGRHGYVPLEFDIAVSQLVYSDAFKPLLKIGQDLRLDQVKSAITAGNICDGAKEAIEGAEKILAILDKLPEDSRRVILRTLPLGVLENMRKRNIIGYANKKEKEEGEETIETNRWGGRIYLPTYWLSEQMGGRTGLVQGNFYARGMVLEGQQLFLGQPHHKVKLSIGRKKQKNGSTLRDTPTGFWLKDPDQFLLEVENTVAVFEGVFNTATLGRIDPDLSKVSITNVGLGYRELIAFLRWLGVSGDTKASSSQGMGKNIKRLILGTDFDQPGAKAFWDRKATLQADFPELEIVPIQPFLPPEIQQVVPSYDTELFKDGGPLEGFKLDLNDLLIDHHENWAKENGIDKEREKAIAEIKKKYRYQT